MKLSLVAFASLLIAPAHASQGSPLIYECAWGKETARINFTDFIATFAGTDNELDVGDIAFGFPAPGGRYIDFDVLPSHDEIWEKRPETISGNVVSGYEDLREEPVTIPVRCSLVR